MNIKSRISPTIGGAVRAKMYKERGVVITTARFLKHSCPSRLLCGNKRPSVLMTAAYLTECGSWQTRIRDPTNFRPYQSPRNGMIDNDHLVNDLVNTLTFRIFPYRCEHLTVVSTSLTFSSLCSNLLSQKRQPTWHSKLKQTNFTTMASNDKAKVGNAKNFWLYSPTTGFDLTHPATPDAPAITPRVSVSTQTSPIILDPAKSALIVIDMQNYFLSSALGRAKGAGHAACDQLVRHAVPACRKAGIRVVWVNWGLSQEEIDDMPPAVVRAFGFEAVIDGQKVPVDKFGSPRYVGGDKMFEDGAQGKKYSGLGMGMGMVKKPETGGEEVDAGKLLMMDQWNTGLYPPLDKMFEEGKTLATRPDVWIHKNRMSGMWGSNTALEAFLEKEGIRTLLFTGVNTDQCVGGTYQDCFSKGYDCVLLSDGCGTTSPGFAQECVEFNASNTWGFVTTCKALAEGVEGMEI